MIVIKTLKEIEKIKEACAILVEVMRAMPDMVKPGVKTIELDQWAENFIKKAGGEPAFKGVYGFPGTLCISINDEIVHGVPSDRKLKEGDIVSIDGGVRLDDWNSDMAITLPVGEISPEARRLIKCTKKALKRGIKKSKVGNTFGDVSNTIQRYIESQNYSVVRNLCGHGIGQGLHEEPEILNYGSRHSGEDIKNGMVFCLEPMLAMGSSGEIQQDANGSYKTLDGSLSAHFEHLIAIIDGRAEVLTSLQ